MYKYLNKRVKVISIYGKKYIGTITEVNDNYISITTSIFGVIILFSEEIQTIIEEV